MVFSVTVKEEIFVGEKFRTFLSKTFRMKFNFVLSKKVKARRDRSKGLQTRWKKIWYGNLFRTLFNYMKATKLNSLREISSFTVLVICSSSLLLKPWQKGKNTSRPPVLSHSSFKSCCFACLLEDRMHEHCLVFTDNLTGIASTKTLASQFLLNFDAFKKALVFRLTFCGSEWMPVKVWLCCWHLNFLYHDAAALRVLFYLSRIFQPSPS